MRVCIVSKDFCSLSQNFHHTNRNLTHHHNNNNNMDRFMKNLLANRGDVVIVNDSARVHYSESSGFFSESSAEMEVPKSSKADSRWKCKSQSPCPVTNAKTKDSALNLPPKPKTSLSSPTLTLKSKTEAKKKTAPPPRQLSKEEQDANKAQQIIDLVQSLAFRAATAIIKEKKQR